MTLFLHGAIVGFLFKLPAFSDCFERLQMLIGVEIYGGAAFFEDLVNENQKENSFEEKHPQKPNIITHKFRLYYFMIIYSRRTRLLKDKVSWNITLTSREYFGNFFHLDLKRKEVLFC